MELLINKSIQWFKNISEATKDITSGNASHKCPSIRGMANRSAEYLEKHKKYYSHIHWQTGEPKHDGFYIVTSFDFLRKVDTCSILEKVGYKWKNGSLEVRECHIKAWCKLSDIEPYKEEKK